MHDYTERVFDNEQQARRFSYRVKGNVIFTQAKNEDNKISLVYVVRYIPKSGKEKNTKLSY